MPVAWDCDLLLKSVVPSLFFFAEIKMSSDAADSTDTRHEPDQVEPGKGGWDTGGGLWGRGAVGRCKFLPCFAPRLLLCVALPQPAGS